MREHTLEEIVERIFHLKADKKCLEQEILFHEQKALELAGIEEDFHQSKTMDAGHYKIKFTGSEKYSIDDDKLRHVAEEKGFIEYLGTLFRWKAALDKKEWTKAPENVKKAFSAAMDKSYSKVSVTVELTKEEQ